tara:strand:+ start:321 stop:428 length:108 start_codon:yes stop_codon:yes gene_type:complete
VSDNKIISYVAKKIILNKDSTEDLRKAFKNFKYEE